MLAMQFDESVRMGCGEADNGETERQSVYRGCTNRSPTHRLVRQLAPMEYSTLDSKLFEYLGLKL